MKTKQTEMELGVRFKPPTLIEVVDWGYLHGLPTHECEKFFAYHSAVGWMIGRNKMKSWRDALKYWKLRLEGCEGYGKPSKRSVYELTKIIEAKQKIADQIKRVSSCEVATGRKWNSMADRDKYKLILGQIRELNNQLASL